MDKKEQLTMMLDTGKYLPAHFQDQGCEDSPSCLECPWAVCKFDDPNQFASLKKQEKGRQILQSIESLEQQGVRQSDAINQVAQQQNMTARSALRYIRHYQTNKNKQHT